MTGARAPDEQASNETRQRRAETVAAAGSTLMEVGRVLSTRNEKSLRSALEALQTVLAQIVGTDDAPAESAVSAIEAALIQDDSFDAIRMAVQSALRKRVMADMLAQMADSGDMADMEDMYGCSWPWIRDIYPTAVVYQIEDDLYQCDYTINADESVTLGPPIEVTVAYVPAPDADDAALPTGSVTIATEAEPPPADTPPVVESAEVEVTGDIIPLIEKAVASDGALKIKIIQPGWGSSAYYPAAVLERDGPKVFPSGTKMYWNHQTAEEEAARPEGDLSNVAAVLTTGATYEAKGPSGPGLYAGAKAFGPYKAAIDELAPYIGTSIRAFGKTETREAEGRTGPVLTEFTAGRSVDFVTEAGAGGEVLELFESARGRLSAPTPGGTHVADELSAEQARVLREANEGLIAENRTKDSTIARLTEALLLRDARDLITQVLAESEMPDLTRKRLSEDLIRRPAIKDGLFDREAMTMQVREAVKAELTYLAQATGGTGQIKGMGSNGVVSPAWQAQAEKSLAGGLARLGLSEAAASTAAHGR